MDWYPIAKPEARRLTSLQLPAARGAVPDRDTLGGVI